MSNTCGIYNMGLGQLGGPTIIHKRKFRYAFALSYCGGLKKVPYYFVKTASRPDLTIEETEINFMNAKTWIPGKPSWEQVTVTYYDIASDANIDLWSWLATVYDFTDPICQCMASRRQDYTGTASLDILDGCGNRLETWTLNDVWPTAIKFGDLDYSSSEVLDIELTLRYSQVAYFNNCGANPVPCPPGPCSNTTASAAFTTGAVVQ